MRRNGRRIGWSVLWMALAWLACQSVWAQDPPYRPRLMWHIAASNSEVPISFTEDGAYLLVAGYLSSGHAGLLMVYEVSKILDSSTPKGHALASYDYQPDGTGSVYYTFTDRDEQGQEYVVALVNGAVRMWRWVRDPLAFRGGYLEAPKRWGIAGWNVSSAYPLVLRGDRQDRRYNRLAVSGDGNGNLRIVLLDYNASSQSPVLVSGAHASAVTALAYDPATRRLITGGADGLIRVWQVSLDSAGTPSLTPLQTVPAHRGEVRGLALSTSGSVRRLISVSNDGTIAGWNWPTVGSAPVWHKPIETTYPYIDYTISSQWLGGMTPYGDLPWVVLHFSAAIEFLYTPPVTLLVDGATGEVHYRYLQHGWAGLHYQYAAPLIVSPPIGGQRYAAGVAYMWLGGNNVYRGSVGLVPANLQRSQSVASASFTCTAIDTAQSGSTRYLATGYANGELRVYRNTGSGWSLWDASPSLHPNKQVVGVKLLVQGGQVYTVSADIEGQVVIAQHTGSVSPVASASSGLDAAEAMAFGQDSTSSLVAVCGLKDGSAQVEVLRLTWSGSSPSLSSLAGFVVSGEVGPAVDVEFVPGSADVVVSTGTRASRWNFASGSYTRAFNLVGTSDAGRFTRLSVAGGRVWRVAGGGSDGSEWDVPGVNDLSSPGSLLWNPNDLSWADHRSCVFTWDGEHGVWGLSHRAGSQDGSFWLARSRALLGGSTRSQAYNVMQQGLQARLPDGAVCVARDPADGDLFYVGCLDGTVQQVRLPDITPKQMAYAGLSGTLFQVVGNRIATFLTGWPDAFATWSTSPTGVGIRHAAVVRLDNGQIQGSAMLCNADGSGCAPGDVGINALMRLSPSGNVLYGYEVANNRLTGWDGTTMAPLFNTTVSSHWWPVAVDDNRVALLYNEYLGSYQLGTPPNVQTYHRYRPVIRIINRSPSLVTQATRRLDEDTEMRFIVPQVGDNNLYLQGMRWDMNANRRVAAVYGAHYYDLLTPGAYRRRVLLLHRPDPIDWETWVLREVLEQGTDFPSGVYPTMIRFHPNAPNVLYVGLSNGQLWIYRLDANGNLLNRTNPDKLIPTMGNLGAVSAMDVGNYVLNGLNYSAIVFGGPEGLSVWVGFVCQPGWLNEVHFYKTDIAFFPSAGMGYIQVSQPDPSQPPFMVYSNGLVMSAAKLEDLPQLPCPEDVNRDGVVDDNDVLAVLQAFAEEGYRPPDVNCDGIVDDADLSLVLFAFGRNC